MNLFYGAFMRKKTLDILQYKSFCVSLNKEIKYAFKKQPWLAYVVSFSAVFHNKS